MLVFRIMFFVNRENELKSLENLYSKPGFRSLLLYGRRRVGKTYLLKKFLNDKSGTYMLSVSRSIGENIDLFRNKLSDGGIPRVIASNFIELFSNIKPYLRDQILIIDEFQYLIEKDEAVLSDFQYIFDEILVDTSVFIILCGSSMGMVENIGFDNKSPLYGRFSARMKLHPFRFVDMIKFHPNRSFFEHTLLYGALGGIPLYSSYINQEFDFRENIRETFFNLSHPLFNEVEFLIRQELREPSTYFGILQAIANGKTRNTEIANSIYLPAKDISRYLNTLISLDLIKRVIPIDASSKSKRSMYMLRDNYFRFWFRFVSNLRSEIEFLQLDEAMRYLDENLSTYMGLVIEDIVMELFRAKYTRVGKWWHKDKEIDLVAIDDNKKNVAFVEIKWTSKKRDRHEIERVIENSSLVRGLDSYSRNYILISKNGFNDSLEMDNCEFWSAEDLLAQLLTG